MQVTHPQPKGERRRQSLIRIANKTLLILVASALTLFAVYAGYDSLTGDYIEGEVLVVWLITGIAAFLAALSWIAVMAYVRRGRV